MSAAHRASALDKMREHHAEAVRLRTSDPAASRAAAKRAEHAADVVKSIDAGSPVGTVDPAKDFAPGYFTRRAEAGSAVTGYTGGGTTTAGGGGVMSIPSTFTRTRMGYDPDTMVDYTNTNPAYWNSVVAYFKTKPDGNPKTGELGIWIPNLEKEGAERTALAAIAGGVTAHVNSNYSNNTVSDVRGAGAKDGAPGTRRATESLTGPGSRSYTGGAEKAIRLAGTHRGGTDVDTGYAMGSTAPAEHGVHIKGGVVTKGAGVDYVKGGGDFGGLLGMGDRISGDWLTGLLGPMDSDGMRIGGTYPAVRGATGSGVGAGGTKTSVGGLYSGGADPFAKMPGVADYTAYMDPNSMFGGLSDNAAVRSGLLYQPTASDYGAKMEAAGMPSFSPGLLGSFSGAGAPTYGSTPGSFMKPTTGGTAGGGGSGSGIIGDPAAKYAYPEMMFGYKSSLFPKFHSYDALTGASGMEGGTGPWSYMTKGGPAAAIVGPHVYTWGGGGGWGVHDSYDPVETT